MQLSVLVHVVFMMRAGQDGGGRAIGSYGVRPAASPCTRAPIKGKRKMIFILFLCGICQAGRRKAAMTRKNHSCIVSLVLSFISHGLNRVWIIYFGKLLGIAGNS